MINFELNTAMILNTLNGTLYRYINIKITIKKGKFSVRAFPTYVTVTNGIQSVSSFMARISGNQKEINAGFTTDAFNIFTGTVDIEFGYGNEVMDVIKDVDINNVIIPLPPILSEIPAVIADNAWLENLN